MAVDGGGDAGELAISKQLLRVYLNVCLILLQYDIVPYALPQPR